MDATICEIEDCDKPRYQRRRLCSTHTMRKHRYGDPLISKDRRGRTYANSNGYLKQGQPDHPLADSRGEVYIHRATLYDSIGPGAHPCHWCSAQVTWGADLEVDHIDHDRANNQLCNLVPSCHGCNTRRALNRRWHPADHGACTPSSR